MSHALNSLPSLVCTTFSQMLVAFVSYSCGYSFIVAALGFTSWKNYSITFSNQGLVMILTGWMSARIRDIDKVFWQFHVTCSMLGWTSGLLWRMWGGWRPVTLWYLHTVFSLEVSWSSTWWATTGTLELSCLCKWLTLQIYNNKLCFQWVFEEVKETT